MEALSYHDPMLPAHTTRVRIKPAWLEEAEGNTAEPRSKRPRHAATTANAEPTKRPAALRKMGTLLPPLAEASEEQLGEDEGQGLSPVLSQDDLEHGDAVRGFMKLYDKVATMSRDPSRDPYALAVDDKSLPPIVSEFFSWQRIMNVW
eukprot:TRINITY_DN56504_c0_g1_i1.p2 TRINITY_DN56504_c0_g1~~TRINITY_DN56504_c0_g1_i1.p2  ORF type:complete len:148 (+),score=37.07 TRINITY_DN56504_c0_g1_i1:307-750(+)